jgi:ATP-dependent DNA ligase
MEFPLTMACEDRLWSISVDGASMVVTWGKIDGKMQTSRREYSRGKQNRDAAAQAVFEATAAARKKARTGYTPLSSAAARPPSDMVPAAAAQPRPMLALDRRKSSCEHLLDGFLVQPKLDGIRCLVDTETGAMISRSGMPLTGLEHIASAVRVAAEAAAPPSRWLDGEIYRHGSTFQGIVGAARRTVNTDTSDALALQLHLFDIVSELPCSERIVRLNQWFDIAGALVSPGRMDCIAAVHVEAAGPCTDAAALRRQVDEELLPRFESQGYEGAILRSPDAPYEQGKRTKNLIKVKRMLQQEYVVTGITEREKQPGVAAAVRCQTPGGAAFHATPQCTRQEKRDMWCRRGEYAADGWVATVRYQELTAAGIPRFPVCVGLRHADDRGAEPAAADAEDGGQSI